MEPRKEAENKKVLISSKVLAGAVEGDRGIAGGEVGSNVDSAQDPQ